MNDKCFISVLFQLCGHRNTGPYFVWLKALPSAQIAAGEAFLD